jgi:hypothetical protein
MREIKFRYRFQNRKTKEIITAILDIPKIENQGLDPNPFKEYLTWQILSRDQYTGLKDKNGKEIYEGDIVTAAYSTPDVYSSSNQRTQRKFDVRWSYYAVGFAPFAESPIEFDTVEVIGNLYENPGLLKKESNSHD